MTILIVDDEDSTREALRMALSQIGQKTVVEARNGDEALKILDSEKNRIGMIISDW
ncbi:response regulator, partial [Shewanella algae]|uniref:response regulator n=1 Tax=Shewanella algae TaxID=38313 RepID=UPI003CCC8861